jgi:hypothetical protein
MFFSRSPRIEEPELIFSRIEYLPNTKVSDKPRLWDVWELWSRNKDELVLNAIRPVRVNSQADLQIGNGTLLTVPVYSINNREQVTLFVNSVRNYAEPPQH